MGWKDKVARRRFLRGIGASGVLVRIGLPPLEAMLNSSGTAYAAAPESKKPDQPIPTRFVFWFNGNGVPERFWIPTATGPDYEMTPCLTPLVPFRKEVHILSGLDNPAARMPGPGNDHHRSMSALVSGTSFTGRGAGGASIDQLIAAKLGTESRFRSLQIGVCQESHGESIQRNLSWAGYERSLPPELVPHNLFNRMFGTREQSWVDGKRSVLDAVRDDFQDLQTGLGRADKHVMDEHLAAVREVERSIASLPPEYRNATEPGLGGDVKDYPRIAKIQSDLLVHALASRQTRVASYMLTKCQSLVRLPWLGYTTLRHHDYTHTNADSPQGQRILRDICRWHVQEFAYLLAKLKSIPEGDGTLLDHTCLLYVHEHAEANPHKNNGLPAILAGYNKRLKGGLHTKAAGTLGDLYLTVANDILDAGIYNFPTGRKALPGLA
ncbi:MAG TPA: DUF1552 domain-containing protein [Bryobacteraceae bacterium]|jgi:uncharacterized protein DUF1552|nr:DUF1552 domain-containing protein [Bryobacteraceae bacterium]